ncbi:MAG: TrkH family potassium uptake protein, partial [Candidatus Cloacimonadaceae bacterium]|nr:TrkH family potassium uptake protein [Candidatus Cloacimonadaceae bacterium]
IMVGSVFLMLPAASTANKVTPFFDALFTATSATCVTGLIVHDTGSYFTIFGQLVILALIQIGGLGIMTISTAFALILGQRLTLKLENIMQNVVGGTTTLNLFQLLKNIVIVTLLIELVGAAFLFVGFSADYDPMRAAYYSIFHSVSAFCNAGFSLMPDSFVHYVGDPLMNLSLSFLIILGGLGFTVLIDIFRYIFKTDKIRRLTLHTRIVLIMSSALLLIGFVAYFIAEYYYTMDGFGLKERFWGSWFQSVTTRTAGFNTIDVASLSPASTLMTYILMFIGASPGSTGGGIKTTTFAVLVLSVLALLKGRRELVVFNRRIALSNFRESASLITLSMFIVLFVVFMIMLIEPFSFEKIVFEGISAFGTVGLSMGITAQLSTLGKLLITVLMYIG